MPVIHKWMSAPTSSDRIPLISFTYITSYQHFVGYALGDVLSVRASACVWLCVCTRTAEQWLISSVENRMWCQNVKCGFLYYYRNIEMDLKSHLKRHRHAFDVYNIRFNPWIWHERRRSIDNGGWGDVGWILENTFSTEYQSYWTSLSRPSLGLFTFSGLSFFLIYSFPYFRPVPFSGRCRYIVYLCLCLQ